MTSSLILDCDGVLADTERDGHLRAFNQTFAELGIPLSWDEEEYGRLIKVAGGKERMRHALTDDVIAAAGLPTDEASLAETIAVWHRHKSEVFRRLITEGAVAPRSGVKRLASEALEAGWSLAVASTSAQSSVEAVLRGAVGDELAREISVFAGDVVSAKKPAPDIYLAALAGIRAAPESTVAIEDSRNGLLAATTAGIVCLVTRSTYTRAESMSEAAIVVSELGDPDVAPPFVEQNRTTAPLEDYVTLEHLAACLELGAGESHPSEATSHAQAR